jgi:elongation factor G
MPAVETAAIVLNAQSGVEEVARRMMEAAADQRLCRMIIVNKIDAENINLGTLVDDIRDAFGAECLPINLVVEVDEELMEIYLEQGDELKPEQLHEPFEKALREGHLVPICFVSATTGVGIPELLDIFERLMPNPAEGNPPVFLKGDGEDAEEVPLSPDPGAHAIAHVFMVNIDPFKGRLGVFRIYQGTIKSGSQLFVGDARKPIKVGQLLKLNGADHKKMNAGVPGDICAIPRVDEAHYDAVLHDSHDEDNFHLKHSRLPRPMFGLAIKATNDADAQKTSDALHAMEAEDPSLRVEHNTTLNEVVLRGLGEQHLRAVIEEIEDRYGLKVDTSLPSIAYVETITTNAEGHHRHKKQTGGAGQFGEVYLRIEPLPAGTGFEFKSEVVGGSIPSQFIPAVETGVRQVMQSGAISGHPMQDVKVIVYDGKHHSVDSKEIAFVQAGKKAFLEAVSNAAPKVMEPIVDVTFTVPGDSVGGVTGDVAGMRGVVSGTDVASDSQMAISAKAPLKEVQAYHSRLKSLTGGEGTFTMDFSHYAEVPHQVQQELIKEHQQPAGG